MAVRTAQLFVGRVLVTGLDQHVYTCPPGRRTIVKDWRLRSAGGTQNLVLLGLGGPLGAGLRTMQPWVRMAANDTLVLSPAFIVLNEGNTVGIFITLLGAPVDMVISGTELVL